ncbi:hypothetical protein GCM10010273_55030 [Streptomyces lavendulocolor]
MTAAAAIRRRKAAAYGRRTGGTTAGAGTCVENGAVITPRQEEGDQSRGVRVSSVASGGQAKRTGV